MVRIIVHLFNAMGWSEPAATSAATVQDEAVQAHLRMNQKHILFSSNPAQGFCSPEIFPPTSFTSFLAHSIVRA
jgi:hypothetical protein